jgi:hypothetical protein
MSQPYYGPTDEDKATIEYERNFVGVADLILAPFSDNITT